MAVATKSGAGGGGWRRWLLVAPQVLAQGFALVLLALALRFQTHGATQTLALVLVPAIGILLAGLWLARGARSAWAVFGAVMLAATFWYSTIRPSNHRDWAPDVAHGATAVVGPDVVTIANIRNFDWRSTEDFTERWETRSYALSALTTVDIFTSVWASPAIAHTLVSFGFRDGQHIVFSAEIRRERNEVFTSLGGFFREFELVLIAADERDIIRLRTDVRGEKVSGFRVEVPLERKIEMFLLYLDLANRLEVEPAFYNTATANCTTVVWKLARLITPGIPMDWRVLLSGYLPLYLHDLGIVAPDLPSAEMLARARLPKLGAAGPDTIGFSRHLRAGVIP